MTDLASISAITMPRWGMAMEEGTVARWHIDIGAPVKTGDEVLDIETTKAAGSIEAKAPGVLRLRTAAEGEVVAVGSLLGIIAPPEVSDDEIKAFAARFATASRDGSDQAPQNRRVRVEGKDINFVDEGSGDTTVLLIHGFGGSIDSWSHNREALSAHFRVMSLDLPGHGESDGIEGGTAEDLAAVVLGFMDAIGLRQVHLVGHSMGGAVAIALAASHPHRVCSLTLIASTGLGSEINARYIAGYLSSKTRRELRDVMACIFFDEAMITNQMLESIIRLKRVDGAEAALARIAGLHFTNGRQANDGLRSRLLSMPVPCQIIWGSDDEVIPVAHVKGLSEIHLVPNAGHMVHMECGDIVNALITDFVLRV